MKRSVFAAMATAAALAFIAPAQAATIHEGDLGGRGFSKDAKKPTDLGAGVTEVTGTGRQNSFDFFFFTLPAGAQTLTFDFWAPKEIGYSYSAGGQIKTGTKAFDYAWDGKYAGTFQLDRRSPTDTVTMKLGDDFRGTLRIGLYFTHGSDISYRVSSDAVVAAPSVVPLPGAGLMLLTALGGVAAVSRRRRA